MTHHNYVTTRTTTCAAACGLIFAAVLAAAFAGCSSSQTWRADGIGIAVSATSVNLIYGEINRVPPGGYYERERTIDLRPAWQTWFTAPETNCLAKSRLIIDARLVSGETNAAARVSAAENQKGE